MGKTSLLVLFCLAFNSVNCARILTVLPAPSISHQIVFWPVINELVRRGHEVVSISPDPEHGKGKAPANLTEIDLHDISYAAWREILLKEVMGSTGEVVDQIKAIYMSLSKVFNEQMKVDQVRDIILKRKGNFDLLITETVSRPALAFSHIYKVPLVQISSFGPIVFNDHYVGSLTHPIFYPLPWHSKVYDLSTWERIKKIWHHYSFQFYYNNVIGVYENQMLKTHFGPDVPSVSELCDNVDLLILDVHPLWIDNQPSPPSVVYVNGIHQKPLKELPKTKWGLVKSFNICKPTQIPRNAFISIMIARAIVLVLTFVSLAKCARILAVFPTPSVSHQVVFRPITQELVRRGHEVVVITPDPAFPEGQAPVNLTEIDVHETAYEAWLEVINRDVVGKPNDFLTILEFMIKSTWKFFPAEMQTPAVQEIIHKNRGDFDLILTELCIRKSLGFSHIFKVPVIQISSLGSILYNDGIVGSETHPFLFPSSFNRRIYNLTLYEKIFQLWDDLRLKWIYAAAEEKEHELMKDVFGPDVPPLSVLKDNIHLTMLNIHPIWADNQPVPPSVVFIGSIHQKPPKPLPLVYQSYLDASKRGVVYVSFGTNATPSKFAPETVQILLDVLCKLPYDVLLKWDQDNLPVDCKNIKISKWFPQFDILRHPNVKLFITQGGLQSTEESLAAGVPMIGLPILGDQWFNTEKYAHHRIGTNLEWSTLDRESFRKAIDTIINDESYRKNVVKLGKIISDSPNTSLERAVWWVEYVLRHGGARHLRPPTANMSLYQYLEVDLMIAVLLGLALVTLISLLAAYGIWRYVTKSVYGIKVKKA